MAPPVQTSLLVGQTVFTSLRQHPLHYFGLALVFVAIFSGKFSFDRFIAETSRTPWLELRIWASTLACAVAFLLMYRGHLKIPAFRKELLIALAFIVSLHGYFIGNAVLLGDVTRQEEYILDFLLLLLWAFLIVFYFRSQIDLIVFSIIAETVALTLFILALLGWGNPDLNGEGWAPLGGTITFYRIEFLAFCAGLYLSTLTTATYSKGIHLMVAGIGLFSTFASLSKAAFIAAFCIALIATFNLLSAKQYQRAGVITILTCTIFFSFFWIKGNLFQDRLEQATGSVLTVGPAESTVYTPMITSPHWSLLHTYSTKILEKIQSHHMTSIDDLTEKERTQLRALWHLFKKDDLPYYLVDLKPFLISINGMMVLKDGTTRLPMALAAWDAFLLHKWFGIGIGNYTYQSFNNATGVIDTYHYPHNIILEILATTGLVGIVLFLVVIFYFHVLLRQCFLQQQLSIYWAAYGGFIFLTALFSGDIYDFRVYWYVGLIALICFHVSSQDRGGPECIAMPNSDASGQIRSADSPAVQAKIKLS